MPEPPEHDGANADERGGGDEGDAVSEALPTAREIAMACWLGGLLIALSNAIAIMLAVSLPAGGWWLRLRHHAFDALSSVGVAAWLALPATLIVAWQRRRPANDDRRARWLQRLAWLGYAAAGVVAMHGLLGLHLKRQASVVLDGAISAVLFPLYLVLCGLALPAAHIIGGYVADAGKRWRWLPILTALGGVVVSHVLLRDDYPGVHCAIQWVAMLLFGAAVAKPALARLDPRRERALILLAAAAALLTLLWQPANAVRLQLFREPGAVTSYVLARTWWSPPRIALESKAPPLEALPEQVRDASRRGLPTAPLVVVLTVDALRADVIADPANAARLPNFSRLRDEGAWFRNARAAGSQTSVSLTSMFSSRYFSQLRWQRFGKGRTRFLYPAEDPQRRFPELLQAAGIETHSYLALVFLTQPFGITRGFSDEHKLVEGRGHAGATSVMRPLLGQLNKASPSGHFYYAHLMEPHEPYDRGKLKEGPPWQRYMSEVELVDRWLGKLLSQLRRRHRRRAYLILSADHGEAFGEHGTRFHTKTLYDELLRVPLIVWGPGIRRRAIDAPVSLIDVGPTVLHLFDLPAAENAMGRSLLPLARGQLDELPRPVLAEGRLRRALVRSDGLKVIEDSVRKTVEVYDLKSDPREEHNLFDSEPERVAAAVAELRGFFAEQQLRDGGYEPPYKP